MMISQFGINMLVPIFLCSIIGIYIDKKCGTGIWVIILFFVGAAAGFRNVMKFAKKIYEVPAVTRKCSESNREDECDGKKLEEKN
ncbi:MAG: AtpZ/AtpI family protein [Lachnospiraceae bacterium]|nr:AtpZ/AtpI family protein [Lachnospiraceae bacterium]